MLKKFLLLPLLCGGLLLLGGPSAKAALTTTELKPVLEQLLAEHPEILLDFLRNHSEAVLDVAQQGSNERRLKNLESQWKADAKEKKRVEIDGRPVIGPRDAKVKIIAFSDFTCQYCQRAERIVRSLLREYEGKVCYVFKSMPLDTGGIANTAAQYFIAISMQSEELAWKFYHAVFDNREKMLTEGDAFLRTTASSLGVDMKRLDGVRKKKVVTNILDEDMKDADKLHIEGTPFYLVNNLVIRGAIPKELFRRAIELELNR